MSNLQTDLENAIASIKSDSEKLHQIVHGNDTIEVVTDGGNVKSAAKAIVDLESAIQDAITTLSTIENTVVSGGGTLQVATIPNLPASKINSGTFSQSRIPNLPASKINSGILSDVRIPASIARDSEVDNKILEASINYSLSGHMHSGALTLGSLQYTAYSSDSLNRPNSSLSLIPDGALFVKTQQRIVDDESGYYETRAVYRTITNGV